MNKLLDNNFVNTTSNLVVKPTSAPAATDLGGRGIVAERDFRTELNQQSLSAKEKFNKLQSHGETAERQANAPSGNTLPHQATDLRDITTGSVSNQAAEGLLSFTLKNTNTQADGDNTIIPADSRLSDQFLQSVNPSAGDSSDLSNLLADVENQPLGSVFNTDTAATEKLSAIVDPRITTVSQAVSPTNFASLAGTITSTADSVPVQTANSLYLNSIPPAEGTDVNLRSKLDASGLHSTQAVIGTNQSGNGVQAAADYTQDAKTLAVLQQATSQPIRPLDASHTPGPPSSTLTNGVANANQAVVQETLQSSLGVAKETHQNTTSVTQNLLQSEHRVNPGVGDYTKGFDADHNGSNFDSRSNFKFLLQQLSNGTNHHLTPTANDEQAVVSRVALATEALIHRTPEVATKAVPDFQLSQALNKPEWANELGGRVFWLAQHNLQQAQLKLNPAHLGSVEIKISIQNDVANISFSAHNAQVREAIEAALPRLREMMGEGGFSQTNVDVSGQPFLKQQGHSGNNSASYSSSTNELEAEDDTLSDLAQQPAYFEHSTTVDYYV